MTDVKKLSKTDIELDEDIKEHTTPKEIKLCYDCYNYLILQTLIENKYVRNISDIAYKIGDKAPYGQASQHNPNSRDFDIKYGF